MVTKKNFKIYVVPLCLAFGLALGTATAFQDRTVEETFEKTEALARDGKVFLNNLSGNIIIKSWGEARVKIDALKVSKAKTEDQARKNAAEVTIEVTKEGSTLRIVTKYPKDKKFWGDNSLNVSVHYTLTVPDKASLEVKSVSGDVDIEAIGGEAQLNCVSGDVTITNVAGVDVNLVSGDLVIENAMGDAKLVTVSGNIHATRIRGSVNASSVSGAIDLEDVSEANRVEGKNVSGNITYSGDVRPQGRYEFNSHSGNVRMVIPGSAAFEFEANSFSGVIDTDFALTVTGKISPKEVRGTVGDGGATIRLRTFSGNIDLVKK